MSPVRFGDSAVEAITGKSLFDHSRDLNVRLPSSCGRTGDCHECVVEICSGADALSSPTSKEAFLSKPYRLACQAFVTNPDIEIEFSVLRRQVKILAEGLRRQFDPQPLTVRQGNDVIYFGDPANPVTLDTYGGALYGLSVDVGTTTVVANLVDLESAEILYTASFENPQRFGGSDVMHRISYDTGQFHGELQTAVISRLNFEIGEMCRHTDIRRSHILEMVVVGNTTMRDLFFGIDVHSIGQKPFKSTIEHRFEKGERDTTAVEVRAEDLGVRIHPRAVVYGGPLISSHVGADTAAGLLAVGMDEEEQTVMFIDVGTNTEVVVGNRHRMLAASCPAGPAFEGGGITYAMPGYEGAVEHLRLVNGTVEYQTIGNKEPVGICGSGLIDLLAELRRTERMNEIGAFTDGLSTFTFVQAKNMTLSRSDISKLAQAKAANLAGQTILLRKLGELPGQFDRLYLAGGFANYIDLEKAVNIGFIAGLPGADIVKAGNAAAMGATMMLLSGPKRRTMEMLARKIEHVELETEPDFFELFVDGCRFAPMILEGEV